MSHETELTDRAVFVETPTISFEVFGIPQTKGSTKAFMRPGMRFPVITNDNPKTKLWAAMIHYTAQQHKPLAPWIGPIGIRAVFGLPMPEAVAKQFQKGRRTAHTTRPDADKLMRALGDALKGLFYVDDSQVVRTEYQKVYAVCPGVAITIWQERVE